MIFVKKKRGHGSYPFNQAPLDPWSLYVERFPSAYNFKKNHTKAENITFFR